jgi:hypothetical protein
VEKKDGGVLPLTGGAEDEEDGSAGLVKAAVRRPVGVTGGCAEGGREEEEEGVPAGCELLPRLGTAGEAEAGAVPTLPRGKKKLIDVCLGPRADMASLEQDERR